MTWYRHFFETALQDLRYALRLLRKNPGFSAVAILTLALGIGATTAIFSVVKAILLDPLPYRDAGQLVALAQVSLAAPHADRIPFVTFWHLRERSRLFRYLGFYGDWGGRLLENGDPEMLRGLRVSRDFFPMLGVRMEVGRGFAAEEELPDRDNVAILTHGLWTRRFGADPRVIGRTMLLSGQPVRIVGVTPPDFYPPRMSNPGEVPQVFRPLGMSIQEDGPLPELVRLGYAIGRLQAGATVGAAKAELNSIVRDLAREYPAALAHGTAMTAEPLQEQRTGGVRTALWVLLGAVTFLLLIACANVANLLLARATARGREIALRAALGGGRGRIARQLLTESLLLAAAGGLAGMLLAWPATSMMATLAPREIPRVEEIRTDGAVLLFALTVSLATGILFGLVPALRASRDNLSDAIKRAGEGGFGRSRHGLRNLLAAGEIAAAFVLVTGTGLLAHSLLRLSHVDPGYDPHNVLTLAVSVRWDSLEQRARAFEQILDKVSAIPGIESASMVSTVPLSQPERYEFHVREHRLANESDAPIVDRYYVSPDYFRVVRIPLRRGRLFTRQDNLESARVAVISETCARALFPHEDPIGQHVEVGALDEHQSAWATIVGIVGDVRQHGMDRGPGMGAYLPQSQNPDFYYRLAARTAGEPMRWLPAVRAVFREIDSTQPVFHIQPMEDYVSKSLADRRSTLLLVGLLGALALTLAAVGIYGVISYAVELRTREMGIRMALGAQQRDVVLMVLRDVAALAAAGLAVGYAISLALGRLLASLLYEVRPWDLAAAAAAMAVLSAAALAAGFVPARRAAAADPIVALRCE